MWMSSWNVLVEGGRIAVGIQLAFTPSMIVEGDPDPPLAPGDGLDFEFPNNDRSGGTVVEVSDDDATIDERDTGVWRIRPAGARGKWVVVAWLNPSTKG